MIVSPEVPRTSGFKQLQGNGQMPWCTYKYVSQFNAITWTLWTYKPFLLLQVCQILVICIFPRQRSHPRASNISQRMPCVETRYKHWSWMDAKGLMVQILSVFYQVSQCLHIPTCYQSCISLSLGYFWTFCTFMYISTNHHFRLSESTIPQFSLSQFTISVWYPAKIEL